MPFPAAIKNIFGGGQQRKNSNARRESSYGRLVEIYAAPTAGQSSAAPVPRPKASRVIVFDSQSPAPTRVALRKQEINIVPTTAESWCFTQSIMLRVFTYVGIGQLFLGQPENTADQYLPRQYWSKPVGSTRLVCRKWAQFAKEMALVDLRSLRTCLQDKDMQKILNLFTKMTELSLSECRRLKFSHFSFDVCKNISVLNLSACSNLTDEALRRIALQLPKLRSLILESCSRLSHPKIETLRDDPHPLEVLDLSACSRLTIEAINELVSKLPKLKELHLSTLETIDNPKIASGTLELLVAERCSSLEFPAVCTIIEESPNLHFLSVAECDRFQEEKGPMLYPPAAKMHELNVSGTYHTDDTVASIVTGMPNLKILDIGNSETIINPIFPTSMMLECLILNQCSALTDQALEMAVRNLSRLRRLSCNSCDALVRPLIASTSLFLLDVSNCINLLTDKTEKAWAFCPSLHTLFIGFNPDLDDGELELLAHTLHNLRHLNLYRATGLHQPDLGGFSKVEIINFNECWNLEDGYLDEIVLPNLRTIYVSQDEWCDFNDDDDDRGDVKEAA